ncbi:TIGR02281 family clan AA aspartic protease [Bartonella sp. LJL80]
MKSFWLIIAVLAAIILVFMGYNNSGNASIDTDKLAQASYYGIWGLVLASGLLGSGIKLTHMVRSTAIWLAAIFALMLVYNTRYEIQDFASNITAGLIPGSPVTRYTEDGTTVTLERAANGHFQSRAEVDGKSILFTIDTGASSVILSYEDAAAIGIDVNKLSFTLPVDTANGQTHTAVIMIDALKIGAIERHNIPAMVSKRGDLSGSLLGMSYLDRLSGYSVRGDRLILVD